MERWTRIAGLLVISATLSPASREQAAAVQTTGSNPAAQEETASAQQAKENPDANFMRRAAMSSIAEVELGKLATQNAASADVKQFGQRMVDDHTKANDELKTLASKKGVTLLTELDEKYRATRDKLAQLQGAEFDKAYMQRMVSDHRDAVNLFQREGSTGKDVDGRAWAKKTLPVLQQHLQMARDLNTTVRKGARPQ